MIQPYKRPLFTILLKRLKEPRRFIQVLSGPRQTGKTTLAWQLLDVLDESGHYASADEPTLRNRTWIEQQWESARAKIRVSSSRSAVLVLDEIQKIPGWSETVKKLWDEDARDQINLHVLLLGSSALLIQKGISESLAGRFEMLPVTHWSFQEMKEAFGWNADQYIFYGGYPGSAELIREPLRWSRYISDSLIETTVSRDIMLMTRIDKPALLRHLFEMGCHYSGQILSYHKMLGQLHDAGNTTTLAHYLDLLSSAGLLGGIQKYSGKQVRRRASSPKLQVYNTALMAAVLGKSFEEFLQDPVLRGRMTESAVGAHLINSIRYTDIRLFYWSDRNREVDYVLGRGDALTAIEVKSGWKKMSLPGMEAFSKAFPVEKKLLVGRGGIPLEDFLSVPAEEWVF